MAGVYVKAYVKSEAGAVSFHKDGYTDRRGLMDFWTLTTKPVAKVRTGPGQGPARIWSGYRYGWGASFGPYDYTAHARIT